VGWTSIYQLFWCSPGVQGFDTLPYEYYVLWLSITIWLSINFWLTIWGYKSHLVSFVTGSTLTWGLLYEYNSWFCTAIIQ
jgi:hypothetical protein